MLEILRPETIQNTLQPIWDGVVTEAHIKYGELTLIVSPEKCFSLLNILKENELISFEQLLDITGVDYAAYGIEEWDVEASNHGFSRGVTEAAVGRKEKSLQETEKNSDMPNRFAVVYHLLSISKNARIRVKSYLEDNHFPMIDSVVDLWAGANWFEREAYDMYGIVFKGHPDLRRILTDYGFIGHPLRKDFPLTGHVEAWYDPEIERVVYQPVTIESRVVIPRMIRKESN